MSIHQRGKGNYYVKYRDSAGVSKTKSFGKDKLAAEAFEEHLAADRKLNIRPQHVTRSEIFLNHLAQLYLDDRRANGKSEKYAKELAHLLNEHIFKLIPFKPVDELTYIDMMAIAKHYKDREQATRNRYLGYLRAIFKWGIRHDITKNNPLKGWSKEDEPKKEVQLTVEDLKKIMSHAAPHLKWAIEVEWNIGTRPGPSELLSIQWKNIDFEKGEISVYATKTKKWRHIPISDEFRSKLLKQKAIAKTDYVVEYHGEPMKKFRRSFGTACEKAGITYPCRMYDVRHLFATIMLNGGADLAAVSKLLGHSDIQTTTTFYYELQRGEKERAIGLLPSLSEDNGRNEL